MRIGFFTDTFLPQANGVVTSLLSFGPELVRRGHEVSVFCPKSNVKEFKGMAVFSYPAVTFRAYPEFKIAVPQGRDRAPKLDIVHTHSPFTMGFFGWRVAKLQNIPRVSTFHTLLSEYAGYVSKLGKIVLKPVTWEFCRTFYNRHRKLIAPSKTLKKILEDHKIRKPIETIPNGIDTNFFHPFNKTMARKKLGIDGEKIFLSLGRLGHEKNVDIVIRALENLDAKLVIVGRGPAKQKLEKLTRKLGLQNKVIFEGFVPEKLKPLYYSAADALIIASEAETQGLVVVEAMACGTPAIGVDSGAIPEIISDGKNGYLFKPKNIGELTEKIETFEPSKLMKKNATQTSKNYSIEKCTDELEKFYRSL
jgi:glycosyltransferase involved in cell wall biosynthesis